MANASVPPSASEVLTAETVRDPELWLRVVAWTVVAFAAAQVLLFSFGRDQGIYATVASGILDGQMPYRDAWDFKPPGIFLVYAGAFATFGENMMAPRILEVLSMVGVVLACRRLGARFFDSSTAGLLGGAIAALVHAQLEFWHSGQPETFGGALTLFALVLTTEAWPRRREVWSWCAVGVLFGLAFLLKPPMGGGAVVCAGWVMARRRRDGESLPRQIAPFLVMGAASLVPILLVILWFWVAGALPHLAWTLGEFAPGYTKLGWEGRSILHMLYKSIEQGFFNTSALFAAGIVAAAALHPRSQREGEGWSLILGLLGFQLLGVTLQAKFFQYHFAASVPLFGLLAGVGFYKLWRRVGVGSRSGTLGFVGLLVLLPLMRAPVNDVPLGFWERSRLRLTHLLSAGHAISAEELDRRLYYVASYRLDTAQAVARELETHLEADAPIYVWGFEPAIYWLSGLPASSRYIYNIPQRADWQQERARSTLMRELRSKPPEAIVLHRRDGPKMVLGHRRDSVDSLAGFPALEHLIEGQFTPGPKFGNFTVWYRK